ncbi:ABC transporter ATP-binding protein, partial [Mycoplasma nasistruthionis]
ELNKKLAKVNFKSEFLANVIWPVSQNIGNIAYATVTITGGLMIFYSQDSGAAFGLTVGILISFTQFARSFSGPVSSMTQNVNSIILALAGARRVFEVLDQKPETNEGKIQLVKLIKSHGKFKEIKMNLNVGEYAWKWFNPITRQNQYTFLKGEIEFKNVWFKYHDTYTLKDISFKANAGQKIALVGATGAGKTTIINLLCRFYEIEKGQILYDGIDIKNINKKALRKSLGYVLQDPYLFSDTVSNNIAYGSDEIDDDTLKMVAEAANLESHLAKLDSKYDTVLTNSGSSLSQGQKQLLSIARVNYKNPPVLI